MNQTNTNALWALFAASKAPELSADALPVDACLRLGDKDSDVRMLQRALRSVGYELEIDGVFGRMTLECVRSFQATSNLTRDGIVGPQTWAALQAFCGEVTAA